MLLIGQSTKNGGNILTIRQEEQLKGIISFLDTESKEGHDEAVVKFLEEKLSYVTEMKETLSASSAEEDHMRETFSRVKSMHGA